MTPRYQTQIVLAKQFVFSKIKQALIPITESITGIFSKDNSDIELNIEIEDGELSTSEAIVIKDEGTVAIEYESEKTVVTNIRIINKIEKLKKRRLMNLWRIARYGDSGQIYIAMFRPIGKDYLGAIVIKHKERIMFSDYAAVFSLDGESVWRVSDKGNFLIKFF